MKPVKPSNLDGFKENKGTNFNSKIQIENFIPCSSFFPTKHVHKIRLYNTEIDTKLIQYKVDTV